jgi:hypothetical protein
MKFWWVNHNKTFKQEFEGGFIWSPQENRNGGRNQTYINLTLTWPGDLVFSYASRRIQAIGVVTEHHTEYARPPEFGDAGKDWSQIGWIVRVKWYPLSKPIPPKKFIEQIRPLLPGKYSPLLDNGNGFQGCYLAEIPNNLSKLLISIALRENILPSRISDAA